MKTWACWIGFLLLPVLAVGQNGRQIISGRVFDRQTGEMLPGAIVFDTSSMVSASITDHEGRFSLPVASTDTAAFLAVSYMGYQRLERLVRLPASDSLELPLQPVVNTLAEVAVVGERLIAEAFRVEKIEKLDIYTNPIAKADPLLAVNAMAASTTTDESAAISLRGSSPAATSVFFNEVPIYDGGRFAQLNGIGTFSIFNTNLVENVQVFPSNPPLEFGNTASGLIAIQTDEYIPSQRLASVSVTMAGLGGLVQLPASERSGLTLFANYQPSLLLQAANPQALAQLPHFASGDGGGYWYFRPDSLTTIKLFNYTIAEEYQFRFNHPSASFLFEQQRRRNFTVANFRRLLRSSVLSVNAGLSFDRQQFKGGNLQWRSRQQDYYLAFNFQRFGQGWSYKLGLSADHRQSRGQGQFPLHAYALAESHPGASFSGTFSAPAYEAYFFGRYKLCPSLKLGLGLRKNLPWLTERDYWSGQVNTQWSPGKGHSFIFSLGQYHRLNLPGAGSDGGWVDSRQLALDWQWRMEKWELQSALFRKWETIGPQRVTIRGAEGFAAFRLPGSLETTFSFTIIDAQVQEGAELFPSEFDMDYFLKWGLDYRFGQGWNLGASFLWRQGVFYQPVVGSRFDDALAVFEPVFAPRTNQRRLPNYAILNLSASRIFPIGETANVIAFVNCNNLFDRQNISSINYNHDYSQEVYELFSRRLFFAGLMFNFL